MRTLSIVWRYGRWVLLLIVVGFMALVIVRIPVVMKQKDTAATVAAIHATHLTLSDVDGTNLPPEPSPNEVDATVAGVDANANGIRDDVELALFKKYPDNIALRAAALQYAMSEQRFLVAVNNFETWIASDAEASRAIRCAKSVSESRTEAIQLLEYVDDVTFNTDQRIGANEEAAKYTTSSGNVEGENCDVYAQ